MASPSDQRRCDNEHKIPKDSVCLYPAYINAKRTTAEGRRIPKDKGVENPTSQEIVDILKNAGLDVMLEKKMYPRDQARDWTFQGRIRVQLKEPNGNLMDDRFPTRKSLMLYAAEMIPKLKSRLQKGAAVPAEATTQAQKQQKKKKAR